MDFVTVQCPWCFEIIELDLDPETEGALVQDCEVCCNPLQIVVERDDDGAPNVHVDRAQ